MADLACACDNGLCCYDFTIASAATTSEAIEIRFGTPVALYFPASFTGASISFQASMDGTTYGDVYCRDAANSKKKVSVPFTASAYVRSCDECLLGVRYLKIVSASLEDAERTIKVIVKEI